MIHYYTCGPKLYRPIWLWAEIDMGRNVQWPPRATGLQRNHWTGGCSTGRFSKEIPDRPPPNLWSVNPHLVFLKYSWVQSYLQKYNIQGQQYMRDHPCRRGRGLRDCVYAHKIQQMIIIQSSNYPIVDVLRPAQKLQVWNTYIPVLEWFSMLSRKLIHRPLAAKYMTPANNNSFVIYLNNEGLEKLHYLPCVQKGTVLWSVFTITSIFPALETIRHHKFVYPLGYDYLST